MNETQVLSHSSKILIVEFKELVHYEDLIMDPKSS